jgi:nicotinamide phosphoribosyltransferase
MTTDGHLAFNPIIATDAYKMTHWTIYPEGTERVYSYLESRGGTFPSTMFFGLQIYLKKYLEGIVIDRWMIDEAEAFTAKMLGNPNLFNREGWEYILEVHGGKLPVEIRAVPEGTVVGNHNVLFTITNTDTKVPWVTNFLETLLFETLWYGSTVATVSYFIKNIIEKYARITGEHVNPFHLNDFGMRGVSSLESAGIGGAAHLVNFMGTDNLEGIRYAMYYYNTDVCGYSVVASEHSVVTMYGLGVENEIAAYERMIDQNPTGIVSSVSDTYDFEYCVDHIYGVVLRDKILARDGKWVVRPDSGHPPTMAVWTLRSLWKNFGGTVNEFGYKVLNPKVGVIYGDGINPDMIDQILSAVVDAGFAVSNIIFGMGGALLQGLNRDTQRMAIKASWGVVNGIERDVQKTTKTDKTKASKKGRLKLVKDATTGGYVTVGENDPRKDELVTVFRDGHVVKEYTFDEIRATADTFVK